MNVQKEYAEMKLNVTTEVNIWIMSDISLLQSLYLSKVFFWDAGTGGKRNAPGWELIN